MRGCSSNAYRRARFDSGNGIALYGYSVAFKAVLNCSRVRRYREPRIDGARLAHFQIKYIGDYQLAVIHAHTVIANIALAVIVAIDVRRLVAL